MGFSLVRNPFAVPLPLEQGQSVFSDRVVDPHHTEVKDSTDGYYVGGGVKPKPPAVHITDIKDKNGNPSPYLFGVKKPKEDVGVDSTKFGFSEFADNDNTLAFQDSSSSFILNSEMRRIRQAELVLLKEETKWGRVERSSDGAIPVTQLFTTKLSAAAAGDGLGLGLHTPSLLSALSLPGPCPVASHHSGKGKGKEANAADDKKFGSLLENSVISTFVVSKKLGESLHNNNKLGESLHNNNNLNNTLNNSLNNSVDLESNPVDGGVDLKRDGSGEMPWSKPSTGRKTPTSGGGGGGSKLKKKKKSLADRLAEIGALREEITKAKLALNEYDAEGGPGGAAGGKFKKTPQASYLMTNKTSLNANMLRASDQVGLGNLIATYTHQPTIIQTS